MKKAMYKQSDEWDVFEKQFECVTTFYPKDLEGAPEIEIKEGVAFVGKCIVRAKEDEFIRGEYSHRPVRIDNAKRRQAHSGIGRKTVRIIGCAI